MNKNEMAAQYQAAYATTSFSEHQRFIKQLLASDDPEMLDFHFSLLANRQNAKLYQRLRLAFAKRGEVVREYLVKRADAETNPQLLGDALHILGTIKAPEAIPLARKMVQAADPELRDRAVYVLGWLGTEADADVLADRLLKDADPRVRGDSATAMDQMRMRLPASKARLLVALRAALMQETDENVLAWIVITLQYFLNKKFGLKEHVDEGRVSGDVRQARLKALEALDNSGA